MTDTDDSASAIDVIHWLLLAKELDERGLHDAARRWQAKAEEWLSRRGICADGAPAPSATEERLESTDNGPA